MHEVLSTAEMTEADRRAVAVGVSSLVLMENAGVAAAHEAMQMLTADAKVVVVCGPGNNGGDGFVVARLWKANGTSVRLLLLGEEGRLRGDAAIMAQQAVACGLTLESAVPSALEGATLIVDALFGAGLSRSLAGDAAALVSAMNACGVPILAIDVPSGLDGTTGAACGAVVQATRTVTFFRKKPGHLVASGRAHCGTLVLADIGIPKSVLRGSPPLGAFLSENVPSLWQQQLPQLHAGTHKYMRGHVVVVSGGPLNTGAARLAARAALRVGAGLVTVAGAHDASLVNAHHLTAIMVTAFESNEALAALLSDRRKNAVLLGPAAGVDEGTRSHVATVLASSASVVLDADALTSFASEELAEALFRAIQAQPERPVVLTPHEGEFTRLFGSLPGSKLDRAREAARKSGAIVVLKGSDTVIAAPSGRAAINAHAPPTLATAGSGDVLAGLIAGLIAQYTHQTMDDAFAATCAGVWMHGACATAYGLGLIAEDLPEVLPRVLQALASV